MYFINKEKVQFPYLFVIINEKKENTFLKKKTKSLKDLFLFRKNSYFLPPASDKFSSSFQQLNLTMSIVIVN